MEENQKHIPEGWQVKQVQEFALKMRSGGTPKSDNPNYYNGEIPFVAIDDLTSANKYLAQTQKHITKEGLNNSAAWIVPVNTIMYSIYATLGVPRINVIEAATNQAILNIIPDETKISLEFLYYLLLEKRGSILAHSSHTTQSNLNAKIVKELEFIFPKKLTEQTAIATILSKVDEAIAQTEQLIAKYTRIKTGLMQDLLTKGIDENGNIRSEETHEFKDSPLGRIPKEWECVEIGSITKSLVPGRNKPKAFNGDIPWITTPDFEGIYLEKSKLSLGLTKEEIKKCGNKVIPKNSIVMTCVGELGICAVNLKEITINQQLHSFVPNDKSNPYFLMFIISNSKQYFQKIVATNVVPYMNKKNCESILVISTELNEQNKIVEILIKADEAIEKYKKELSKLQSLKTGLMQDLLSGKVRVNHLIKETASV